MNATSNFGIEIRAKDKTGEGIQSVENNFDRLGAAANAAAAVIGGVLTNKIKDLATEMVNLWHVQERAEATLAASFRGATSQMLADWKAFASNIQAHSIFGDEDIIQKAIVPLTTMFENWPVMIERITQLSADFASKHNRDIGAVAQSFGQYISMGGRGLSMLERRIGNISQAFKDQIKDLEEQGKHQEAQVLIVGMLESKFKGVAKEIANTDFGRWEQFGNDLGDLGEAFGKIVREGLRPFLAELHKAVLWVANLSDNWKIAIVAIGGGTFAFGSLLTTIFAVKAAALALTAVFGGMAAAVAVATGGLSLVFAGIVAGMIAIALKWDEVSIQIERGLLWIREKFYQMRNTMHSLSGGLLGSDDKSWVGKFERAREMLDIRQEEINEKKREAAREKREAEERQRRINAMTDKMLDQGFDATTISPTATKATGQTIITKDTRPDMPGMYMINNQVNLVIDLLETSNATGQMILKAVSALTGNKGEAAFQQAGGNDPIR